MTLAVKTPKILTLSLITIALILITSFYLLVSPGLSRFDRFILDLCFRLRGPVDPGKDVVIVALDRESSEQMQRKTSGWRRSDFAEAIENLSAAGADLIAIDYLFVIPDDD